MRKNENKMKVVSFKEAKEEAYVEFEKDYVVPVRFWALCEMWQEENGVVVGDSVDQILLPMILDEEEGVVRVPLDYPDCLYAQKHPKIRFSKTQSE
jgi:hypothetical protein